MYSKLPASYCHLKCFFSIVDLFFMFTRKKCRSFVKKESEIFSVQMNKRWSTIGNKLFIKGQLNSEWIYEVIVSPKMPTKHFSDFCPGGLLEGRAEI